MPKLREIKILIGINQNMGENDLDKSCFRDLISVVEDSTRKV